MTGQARYVYGVAGVGRVVELGEVGIGRAPVYTIPHRDLCAIVHDCLEQPYHSDDDETLTAWVLAHQAVVDEAARKLGTVIPLRFNTILRPRQGVPDVVTAVIDWLESSHVNFKRLLTEMDGKAEYGVRVSYSRSVVADLMLAEDAELRRLGDAIATKSAGLAYMWTRKLESSLKSAVEGFVAAKAESLYRDIRACVEDIVAERAGTAGGDAVELMNLSCLVHRDRVDALGEVLDGVSNLPGFSVRFTGPWPPYSFVRIGPALQEVQDPECGHATG